MKAPSVRSGELIGCGWVLGLPPAGLTAHINPSTLPRAHPRLRQPQILHRGENVQPVSIPAVLSVGAGAWSHWRAALQLCPEFPRATGRSGTGLRVSAGGEGGFGIWVLALLHPVSGRWGTSCPPGTGRGPRLPREGPHGLCLPCRLLLGTIKAQLCAQMHFAYKRQKRKKAYPRPGRYKLDF